MPIGSRVPQLNTNLIMFNSNQDISTAFILRPYAILNLGNPFSAALLYPKRPPSYLAYDRTFRILAMLSRETRLLGVLVGRRIPCNTTSTLSVCAWNWHRSFFSAMERGKNYSRSEFLDLRNSSARQTKESDWDKTSIGEDSEEDLPLKIGRRFAKIAVTCLTCLDANNGFRAESEFLDENGVLVGVRFIEKVGSLIFLQKLLIYI